MNVFAVSNYRAILRKIVEERKAIDPLCNFQTIAEATRIPKSYLSKVSTEKAHFSPDQLFLVGDHLALSPRQMRYLLLLLEHERCSVKKRRDSLDLEIQAIRDEALDSREHLKARADALGEEGLREYFLDPLNQLVHMCLSIPRYQRDVQILARDLSIQLPDLRGVIERLESLGLIEQSRGKISTVVKSLHLPRTSPAYRSWRSQFKLLSMERLDRRPRKEDYSFSVTFSATREVRDRIKADFLDLLKRSEEAVTQSKQEEAFQMTFELFGWT